MDRRVVTTVGVVAILLVGGYFTNWFGLASPGFQPGVQYEFQYMHRGTAPVLGVEGVSVETRHFVIDQTTTFPVLERGLRGELAAFEDTTLPPNTFVFEEKVVPEVLLGGEVVQEAYSFRETRYHALKKEDQRVIPRLQPKK